MELIRHELQCDNGHVVKLSPSKLEEFLLDGDWKCSECESDLNLEDELSLVCHICSMVYLVSGVEEAKDTLESRCGPCKERGFNECSIHVPNSFYESKDQYDWMKSGRDGSNLKRKGRTDYWEGVVHFCEAEEFASIYDDGHIRASKTGFYKAPAVCLTEATTENWVELKRKHGDFGYVFRKRDLIAAGGGPAVYMSDALINSQPGGFSKQIKPFINVLRLPSVRLDRKKYDFLHEREWRLPHDLDLDQVAPQGVVFGEFTAKTKGWQNIFQAAMEIEEIYLP